MCLERPQRNLKLTIEYDGTSFHGWQAQPGLRTVQGTLAAALGGLTGEEIELVGASRTDRGVHALGQVAHLKTRSPVPCERFASVLNGRLPPDARVRGVVGVDEGFHARFSAVAKRYRYLIDRDPVAGVFLARRALHYPAALDVERMREAARVFVGEHDFAAFRSNSGDAGAQDASTVRTVHRVDITAEGDRLSFVIVGRSFLYKMVRTLVGTLLEVGRGHWSVDRVREALESRDRRRAGPSLPPQGLCLEEVYYDPALVPRAPGARMAPQSRAAGGPSNPWVPGPL